MWVGGWVGGWVGRGWPGLARAPNDPPSPCTHTHPEDPVRQLFPDESGTDSEGLVSSDQGSQSECSTIESPRHGIVDDYLSDGSPSDRPLSSDNEFSTDVSSTRKRRK